MYKLSTLSEVTELVSRIPDIKEVLHLVLHRAMTAVHSKIGSIMLLDPQTQTLRIAAAEGLEDAVVVGTTVRVREGISGKVAQTGSPSSSRMSSMMRASAKSMIPNTTRHPSFACRCGLRTVLLASSISRRKVARNRFGALDLKFLSTLLGHIGFAVENARLLKEAKKRRSNSARLSTKRSSQLELAQQQLRQSGKILCSASSYCPHVS